ncbi:MAG: cobalamin-dependent protein, partial [Deltaproteobacteria bacterium]|nr:cobalamin-dependent protein [Deltaproteobacteria bacterium]
MRVVLINPNYSRHISAVAQTSVGPPLGLAYLAAVLLKDGIETNIIDANALSLDDDEIIKEAAYHEPAVIGLTAVTPTISIASRLAGKIRKALQGTKVVIGGCHVTFLPRETLEK